MLQEELVFEINISGKAYGFFLDPKPDGLVHLVIPDAGGQADMSPKYPFQLQWLEPKLSEIHHLKRIWTTIWELATKEALDEVIQLLSEHGRRTSKHRSDFY